MNFRLIVYFCCQGPALCCLLGLYFRRLLAQIWSDLLLLGIQILVFEFLLIFKTIFSHFAVYFKFKLSN